MYRKEIIDWRNMTNWKGKPRETLLKPDLHISQFKQIQCQTTECLYPDWWGHEEPHQNVASLKKSYYKNDTVAGLPSVTEPASHPIHQSFPKKMVDEMTQTDSSLLPKTENDRNQQLFMKELYDTFNETTKSDPANYSIKNDKNSIQSYVIPLENSKFEHQPVFTKRSLRQSTQNQPTKNSKKVQKDKITLSNDKSSQNNSINVNAALDPTGVTEPYDQLNYGFNNLNTISNNAMKPQKKPTSNSFQIQNEHRIKNDFKKNTNHSFASYSSRPKSVSPQRPTPTVKVSKIKRMSSPTFKPSKPPSDSVYRIAESFIDANMLEVFDLEGLEMDNDQSLETSIQL
ncbi:hypothetical protein BC833DRAFT_576749 [Globomyces pollinis-pini]|nr:hypothetical protein BC833DRAFT_576749 [Globomyces pollinis-pini]